MSVRLERIQIIASTDAEYNLRSAAKVYCRAAGREGARCTRRNVCSIGRAGKQGLSLTPQFEKVNGINIHAIAHLQECDLVKDAEETAFLENQQLHPSDEFTQRPLTCTDQIYTIVEAQVSGAK